MMPGGSAGGREAVVYIGTLNETAGIHSWRMDLASGKMEKMGLAADLKYPVFQALHPNRRILYSVSGVDKCDVCAFSIDPQTGKLGLINKVDSHGICTAYISLDKTNKNLLAANYGDGSVSVFPVHADGSLGEASDVVKHHGEGNDPKEHANAHSIIVSPDNRFVLAADLGLDRIFVYRFDAAKGKLTPNDPPFVKTSKGAGPRHVVFHPSGRFVYVINETQNTILVFAWDKSTGTMTEVQTISTLPQDFKGTSYGAEVRVDPRGRFLYGSNRGHDSIAVFKIDQRSGKLELVECVSTQGKFPRHFDLDPTGSWLVAANQQSNNLIVYAIDRKTGKLKDTGARYEVAMPSCVRFLPLKLNFMR